MRKQYLAMGACAASLAMLASPALAQNTSGTPDTYQAARAAGAAAQKVAPPNLVMPADMGGGTYAQRQTQNTEPNTGPTATSPMPDTTNTKSNADNPNGAPSDSGMHGTSLTPSNSGTTTPSSGNNTASPNAKPGG